MSWNTLLDVYNNNVQQVDKIGTATIDNTMDYNAFIQAVNVPINIKGYGLVINVQVNLRGRNHDINEGNYDELKKLIGNKGINALVVSTGPAVGVARTEKERVEKGKKVVVEMLSDPQKLLDAVNKEAAEIIKSSGDINNSLGEINRLVGELQNVVNTVQGEKDEMLRKLKAFEDPVDNLNTIDKIKDEINQRDENIKKLSRDTKLQIQRTEGPIQTNLNKIGTVEKKAAALNQADPVVQILVKDIGAVKTELEALDNRRGDQNNELDQLDNNLVGLKIDDQKTGIDKYISFSEEVWATINIRGLMDLDGLVDLFIQDFKDESNDKSQQIEQALNPLEPKLDEVDRHKNAGQLADANRSLNEADGIATNINQKIASNKQILDDSKDIYDGYVTSIDKSVDDLNGLRDLDAAQATLVSDIKTNIGNTKTKLDDGYNRIKGDNGNKVDPIINQFDGLRKRLQNLQNEIQFSEELNRIDRTLQDISGRAQTAKGNWDNLVNGAFDNQVEQRVTEFNTIKGEAKLARDGKRWSEVNGKITELMNKHAEIRGIFGDDVFTRLKAEFQNDHDGLVKEYDTLSQQLDKIVVDPHLAARKQAKAQEIVGAQDNLAAELRTINSEIDRRVRDYTKDDGQIKVMEEKIKKLVDTTNDILKDHYNDLFNQKFVDLQDIYNKKLRDTDTAFGNKINELGQSVGDLDGKYNAANAEKDRDRDAAKRLVETDLSEDQIEAVRVILTGGEQFIKTLTDNTIGELDRLKRDSVADVTREKDDAVNAVRGLSAEFAQAINRSFANKFSNPSNGLDVNTGVRDIARRYDAQYRELDQQFEQLKPKINQLKLDLGILIRQEDVQAKVRELQNTVQQIKDQITPLIDNTNIQWNQIADDYKAVINNHKDELERVLEQDEGWSGNLDGIKDVIEGEFDDIDDRVMELDSALEPIENANHRVQLDEKMEAVTELNNRLVRQTGRGVDLSGIQGEVDDLKNYITGSLDTQGNKMGEMMVVREPTDNYLGALENFRNNRIELDEFNAVRQAVNFEPIRGGPMAVAKEINNDPAIDKDDDVEAKSREYKTKIDNLSDEDKFELLDHINYDVVENQSTFKLNAVIKALFGSVGIENVFNQEFLKSVNNFVTKLMGIHGQSDFLNFEHGLPTQQTRPVYHQVAMTFMTYGNTGGEFRKIHDNVELMRSNQPAIFICLELLREITKNPDEYADDLYFKHTIKYKYAERERLSINVKPDEYLNGIYCYIYSFLFVKYLVCGKKYQLGLMNFFNTLVFQQPDYAKYADNINYVAHYMNKFFNELNNNIVISLKQNFILSFFINLGHKILSRRIPNDNFDENKLKQLMREIQTKTIAGDQYPQLLNALMPLETNLQLSNDQKADVIKKQLFEKVGNEYDLLKNDPLTLPTWISHQIGLLPDINPFEPFEINNPPAKQYFFRRPQIVFFDERSEKPFRSFGTARYEINNFKINFKPISGINVLTYNICWDAMVFRMDKCDLEPGEADTTVCLANIARWIDGYEDEFDFVALQEASRYNQLKQRSAKLRNMEGEHHRSDREDMVTYWNDNKFELDDQYNKVVGEFGPGNPFMLLFFKQRICFINIHPGHNQAIDGYVRFDNKLRQHFEGLSRTDKNEYYTKLTDYDIIIAGDFNHRAFLGNVGNDHTLFTFLPVGGRIMYGRTRQTITNQGFTCCTHDLNSSNHNFVYDHILHTKPNLYGDQYTAAGLRENKSRDVIKNDINFSDHRPVVGRLADYADINKERLVYDKNPAVDAGGLTNDLITSLVTIFKYGSSGTNLIKKENPDDVGDNDEDVQIIESGDGVLFESKPNGISVLPQIIGKNLPGIKQKFEFLTEIPSAPKPDLEYIHSMYELFGRLIGHLLLTYGTKPEINFSYFFIEMLIKGEDFYDDDDVGKYLSAIKFDDPTGFVYLTNIVDAKDEDELTRAVFQIWIEKFMSLVTDETGKGHSLDYRAEAVANRGANRQYYYQKIPTNIKFNPGAENKDDKVTYGWKKYNANIDMEEILNLVRLDYLSGVTSQLVDFEDYLFEDDTPYTSYQDFVNKMENATIYDLFDKPFNTNWGVRDNLENKKDQIILNYCKYFYNIKYEYFKGAPIFGHVLNDDINAYKRLCRGINKILKLDVRDVRRYLNNLDRINDIAKDRSLDIDDYTSINDMFDFRAEPSVDELFERLYIITRAGGLPLLQGEKFDIKTGIDKKFKILKFDDYKKRVDDVAAGKGGYSNQNTPRVVEWIGTIIDWIIEFISSDDLYTEQGPYNDLRIPANLVRDKTDKLKLFLNLMSASNRVSKTKEYKINMFFTNFSELEDVGGIEVIKKVKMTAIRNPASHTCFNQLDLYCARLITQGGDPTQDDPNQWGDPTQIELNHDRNKKYFIDKLITVIMSELGQTGGNRNRNQNRNNELRMMKQKRKINNNMVGGSNYYRQKYLKYKNRYLQIKN